MHQSEVNTRKRCASLCDTMHACIRLIEKERHACKFFKEKTLIALHDVHHAYVMHLRYVCMHVFAYVYVFDVYAYVYVFDVLYFLYYVK